MKLRVNSISCGFKGQPVLENVSMEVAQGEFVTILGPSGCGKSTFLNILAGLVKGDSGNFFVDEEEVLGISGHFAYMPQQDLLFPWKTILDNVCLYARIHGGLSEAREKALLQMEAFGLSGCEFKYPGELSGGMRQRAAFLRTSLCQADIFLLDEPFGALDVITRGDMQDWLLAMRSRLSQTTILVTHDIDEAIYLSDRILVLSGEPATVSCEISVKEKNRSRQWLFEQGKLRIKIYEVLKGVGS